MKTSNNKLYDQFAPYYDTYAHERSNYIRGINRIIVEFLKGHPVPNVLADFGCGTGARSKVLAKQIKARKTVFIDSSKEMIKICQKRSKNTIQADFSDKGFSRKIKKVSVAVSLWNVFGHIETNRKRRQALANIVSTLDAKGLVFIDVNNRYNALQYGWKNVLKNIALDFGGFRNASGDIAFSISIQGKSIPANVHLFSPRELDRILNALNVKILRKYYVNYQSGGIEHRWYRGQILYVCSV
jgi:SAM-dependent methyltransferase